MQLKFTD